MIALERAFEILDRTLAGGRLPVETAPVRRALGRVLACDQTARLDQPPFDRSSMDGYAIAANDTRESYRLIGTVMAGKAPTQCLVPGTAIKVMTGAPTPAGTGRVVMREYAEERDGIVTIHRHDGPVNIRFRGEDLRAGDVVARAGAVLDAHRIANLVACGVTDVAVAHAPRIAIFSTGDEIVDDPAEIACDPARLAPGKIMDSNGPMLAALCQGRGFAVVSQAALPDDKDAIAAALRAAFDQADIVILSGGVSVGESDFVLDALSVVGLTPRFTRLAIKPGKPTVFASAGDKIAFALPGNPVAVFLTFHLFVLRAVAIISGGAPAMREFRLRLARDFEQSDAERLNFIPCRLNERAEIVPLEFHGSAHLAALSDADGFFIAPIGCKRIEAGGEAAFVRWDEM